MQGPLESIKKPIFQDKKLAKLTKQPCLCVASMFRCQFRCEKNIYYTYYTYYILYIYYIYLNHINSYNMIIICFCFKDAIHRYLSCFNPGNLWPLAADFCSWPIPGGSIPGVSGGHKKTGNFTCKDCFNQCFIISLGELTTALRIY